MRIEEKEYTKAIDISIWKKVFPFLAPRKNVLIMVIVMNILCSVVDIIMPLFQRQAIDSFIEKNTLAGLGGFIALYIAVIVFQMWSVICFTRGCMTLDVETGRDMKRALFVHLQKLSFSYYNATPVGYILSRVMNDVARITELIAWDVIDMLWAIFYVVGVFVAMLFLNWKLALIPLVTMISCGAIAIIMERKLDKIYEDISEENAVLTTVAEENLAGVRTVKAFAREKFEIEKFLSHNKRYYDLNISQSKVLVKYYPYFQFVGKALPVAMTILGGVSVMHGNMTLGALVAFVEYSRNCTWPMEMLGWLTNDLSSAVASYKKIKKIYGETAMIKDEEQPVVLEQVKGDISFEHVSFSIEGKNILSDINFTVPAGKTIGIMGATGSGKSSIVNLLQRFYDVSDGAVKVDGTDVRKLSLKQLRSSISVVLQDVFLFSDTIEENIKMGQRKVMPFDEIRRAADCAQAKDFIEKMDEQYATVIGERGVGLSGGQKQRISIARAIAKKAPILILDDSTSALDMETEHEIQKTLNELKDTTKMIIAHRISAVCHADEIIYLKDGEIAERGTHQELLGKNGEYAHMWADYNQAIAWKIDRKEEVKPC